MSFCQYYIKNVTKLSLHFACIVEVIDVIPDRTRRKRWDYHTGLMVCK